MPGHSLDRIDFALLRLMRQDAWLSIKELAVAVGLSASAVHDRIKRLQASGVVRGAHADIDLQAAGFGVEAIVAVELREHDRAIVERLLSDLAELAGIQSILFLSGSVDLIIHLAARDVAALRATLDTLAGRAEVRRLETSMIFEARHPRRLPEA